MQNASGDAEFRGYRRCRQKPGHPQTARMYWGERLEHVMDTKAGDMIYIPADVPHLPFNDGDTPAVAVIARTDPHEQESVVLLPELEALVPG